MTCVLSITHLYQNPCSGFIEDQSELKSKNCEHYDFNWITSSHPTPGIGESPTRCTSSCRIEANSNNRVDNLSTGFSGQCKQDVLLDSVHQEQTVSRQKDELSADTLTDSANIADLLEDNSQCLSNTREKSVVSVINNDSSNQRMQLGIKRKSDTYDIDHVPTKRVSPFLNTPKERKDERKKVLKISLKKLRQLEDPETFLRRTVLVNNTMKRMQSELREDKYRSRKFESTRRKSFNGYNVLNNNCLSNSYLYDDPFLCGVNEKITDDMTDTLIKNVFQDKPCDVSAMSDINADDSNCKQTVTRCSIDTNVRTCGENAEQSNRCEQLITSDTCKQCNIVNTSCACNVTQGFIEPMQVRSSNNTTISTPCNMSENVETKCTNIMECDKTVSVFDVNTTADDPGVVRTGTDADMNKDVNCTGEGLNVDIDDIDVIDDSVYDLQSVLELDKNRSRHLIPFIHSCLH